MKMNKILIVEDERFTRESLMTCIHWSEVDCEIAATAEDGVEAIGLIASIEPDIVISDIKMDGMDGIGLCEHIYNHCPNIRVILVTGHSEFEYAQRALKLGVKDFILKPTDPDELLHAIRRISSEMEAIKKRQEEYQRLQKVVEDNIPLLQERFILDLVTGNLAHEKEISQRQHFLQMDFSCFTMAVLEIDNYEEFLDKYEEPQRQILKLMIRDIGLGVMREYGVAHFIEKEPNLFILFISFGADHDLLEDIQQKIATFTDLSVSLGISRAAGHPQEMNAAFRQAIEALSRKFYIGQQCIIYFQDINWNDRGGNTAMNNSFDGMLAQMLIRVRAGDKEGALVNLMKIEQILLKEKGEKAVFFKNVVIDIVIQIQRLQLGMGKPSSISGVADVPFITAIANGETLKEIWDLLTNMVVKTTDVAHERHKNLTRSVVDRIIAYINDNYRKDISLEELGDIAFMNPKYVCRLIKKETGSNFTDILLTIRIERARQLLRNPDMKTYEVAESVGISDSRYFSKVFKKHTGMTPTEFRQQNI